MITCKCGAQCQDNTKFCPKCGATLTPATVQSNGAFTNPQGTNPSGTYNNAQSNYQNGPFTAQQGGFQNGSYNNPQGGFVNGMPTSGQKPAAGKKKPNIIGIVAGALLAISMFLPYAKASFMGMSYSQPLIKGGGESYLFLLLGIGAVVLSFLGIEIGTLVTGVIATLLSIYEIFNFSKALNAADVGDMIQRGSGFYVMIIASVLLLAAMPLQKVIFKNNQA